MTAAGKRIRKRPWPASGKSVSHCTVSEHAVAAGPAQAIKFWSAQEDESETLAQVRRVDAVSDGS